MKGGEKVKTPLKLLLLLLQAARLDCLMRDGEASRAAAGSDGDAEAAAAAGGVRDGEARVGFLGAVALFALRRGAAAARAKPRRGGARLQRHRVDDGAHGGAARGQRPGHAVSLFCQRTQHTHTHT